MTQRSPFPVLPYLLALLFACAALIALWYGIGRPVVLPDAATPTHKLQCASYTPFGKHQSPFDKPLRIDSAQIDTDFTQLAKRFDCVRTYSMTGLEAVPELARKHGLKVMLGAWVNANPVDTQTEVDALVQSANVNADVVTAVIVGNESLLRKEVTGKRLAQLVGEVKAQVKQPVTYADVWEFWLKHPEVAPAVDFITIHLLPYWEDDPSGIEQALDKVANVRQTFGKTYDKDILIGETGWPSEGRQRETAVPSRVNEALFIRGFVHMAEANGWHYNLIEAFDQPWKRESEGAVGGYWGLFDADRQDKGVLAGPVSNLPNWPFWLGLSGLLAAAALVLSGRPASSRAAMLLPVTAAIGGACIAGWAELATITSRFLGEWLWTAALLALNVIVLAHAALALSARRGWRERLFAWLEARGGWWLASAGFAGAVLMLGLVFDARYRSFPSMALLLPALVYLYRPVSGPRRELTLLMWIIALGIVPQLALEGLFNLQAIGWAATSLLLVGALWRGVSQRT
ncbi:glycoside hydrolase family 17 protein [Aquipseudomonas campi]